MGPLASKVEKSNQLASGGSKGSRTHPTENEIYIYYMSEHNLCSPIVLVFCLWNAQRHIPIERKPVIKIILFPNGKLPFDSVKIV